MNLLPFKVNTVLTPSLYKLHSHYTLETTKFPYIFDNIQVMWFYTDHLLLIPTIFKTFEMWKTDFHHRGYFLVSGLVLSQIWVSTVYRQEEIQSENCQWNGNKFEILWVFDSRLVKNFKKRTGLRYIWISILCFFINHLWHYERKDIIVFVFTFITFVPCSDVK